MDRRDNQPDTTDDGSLCDSCQHSVDVRGIKQVVCLAFLAIRHPTKEGGCGEFENKRKKAPVSSGADIE
jgi:hypothetical protein